jgi:ribosome-binding factor A
MTRNSWSVSVAALILAIAVTSGDAFSPLNHGNKVITQLDMGYFKSQGGRSSPRSGKERSKRQERVGHLVRTELAQIIHSGNIKGEVVDHLESELRQRISVVNADVSPDMRQARITISVRKLTGAGEDATSSGAVDRRRAYSWLVQNVKPLKHTLAQRMKHMKTAPNLSFVQADVSAAVDVMYLIDKVSAGYKRESIGAFGGDDDSLPRGMLEGMDFDDFDENDDDGGDWIEDEDVLDIEDDDEE